MIAYNRYLIIRPALGLGSGKFRENYVSVGSAGIFDLKSSSFGRIIHRVEQEVKLIATLEMVNTKGPTQQLGIHPGVEQLKMRFRNNTAGKIMIRSLHGFLYYYDKNYDLIRTKSEKPLTPNDKVQYFDSTSKDPI
ncbi:hypothetical protein RhiirB3_385455 [Rhizophagus irregularis]|nr:hypothetical protein RhiirB3_385455 [Rhizophagus irregularis]